MKTLATRIALVFCAFGLLAEAFFNLNYWLSLMFYARFFNVQTICFSVLAPCAAYDLYRHSRKVGVRAIFMSSRFILTVIAVVCATLIYLATRGVMAVEFYR